MVSLRIANLNAIHHVLDSSGNSYGESAGSPEIHESPRSLVKSYTDLARVEFLKHRSASAHHYQVIANKLARDNHLEIPFANIAPNR